MFISCGTQTCLHSCCGFLPHLVITHSRHCFFCYCYVQKELDIDFDKVQERERERDRSPVCSRLAEWEMMMNGTFEMQTFRILIVFFTRWTVRHLKSPTDQLHVYLERILTNLRTYSLGCKRTKKKKKLVPLSYTLTSTHSCVYSLLSQDCFCSLLLH